MQQLGVEKRTSTEEKKEKTEKTEKKTKTPWGRTETKAPWERTETKAEVHKNSETQIYPSFQTSRRGTEKAERRTARSSEKRRRVNELNTVKNKSYASNA